MRLRVVCGLEVTMAIFCPTNRFSNVDFPAFGRPIMATNPERNPFFFLSLSLAAGAAGILFDMVCVPSTYGVFLSTKLRQGWRLLRQESAARVPVELYADSRPARQSDSPEHRFYRPERALCRRHG